MKTNYFFKHALLIVALFGFSGIFAQTAKTPNFVEVVSPVITGVDDQGVLTKEDFSFAFENCAAWGDYNNDGYLDLTTVGVGNNWAKQTILYKNNGNGTFNKVVTPFPNLQAGSATWLDYNNDGNLDIFLAGHDDLGKYTTLYKNLGSGRNFEFEEVFAGGFTYLNNGGGNNANRYVAAADYNNDGWVDIYTQGENESGMLAILYKNLQGKGFEVVENPINGVEPFIKLKGGTAAWSDYNNDGLLDLIVNGKIMEGAPEPVGLTETTIGAIYKNNGNGTFAQPFTFIGSEAGDVAWFDYNNDGKLDFLKTGVRGVYNRVEAGVDGSWNWNWHSDIYENDGAGGFAVIPAAQNGLPGGKQSASIALGDVNNDGFEDVLYMNADPNSVFLNNFGDQTFAKLELIYTKPTGGSSEADFTYKGNQWGGTACLADFDSDGDLDAFTSAYGFTPRLMKNELGDGILVNNAPSTPTNLNATIDANGVVTFSWTASTDDITPVEAIKYNVYVKKSGNDSVKFILPADLTTGRLKVNELLAPIATTSYKMNNLTNGAYTFGVQSIDNSRVASHFATAQFLVGPNALGSNLEKEVNIISSKNLIRISSTENIQGNVVIYNSNGLEVYTKSGKIGNNQINLPAGVYVVKVVSDSNTIVRKAIVK